MFMGWGKEYYAFSCGVDQKEPIVEYIKNQENHHHVIGFDDEMRDMTRRNECEFYTYD